MRASPRFSRQRITSRATGSVLAERRQERAPPPAESAEEDAGRFAVAHRMIRSQRRKAAMHQDELRRTAVGARERHLDERDLAGLEVRSAPFEREAARRLPRGDRAGLVRARSVGPFVLLEQPAAELALHHERARPAARAALGNTT